MTEALIATGALALAGAAWTLALAWMMHKMGG